MPLALKIGSLEKEELGQRSFFLSEAMRKKRQRTGIDRDVLVREVASPVGRALVSEAQLDADLEVLLSEDLARAGFVDVLRLSVDEELQRRGTVLRDERDRDFGRVDFEPGLRVPDGAEDAAPVGVLAMQCALDQRRGRDGRSDLVRSLVCRRALQRKNRCSASPKSRESSSEKETETHIHGDLDKLFGALSVADDQLS